MTPILYLFLLNTFLTRRKAPFNVQAITMKLKFKKTKNCIETFFDSWWDPKISRQNQCFSKIFTDVQNLRPKMQTQRFWCQPYTWHWDQKVSHLHYIVKELKCEKVCIKITSERVSLSGFHQCLWTLLPLTRCWQCCFMISWKCLAVGWYQCSINIYLYI